jgi:hypothetical protein
MKNIPVLRDYILFGSLGEVIITQNSFLFRIGCHPLAECLRRGDELFVVVIYHGRGIGSCFDAE